MTTKLLLTLLLAIFCLLPASCSNNIYKKGRITVKVVDETGKPIAGAKVGIGFEQYVNGNYKGIPIEGLSNIDGIFTGEARGTQVVTYGATMEGYYESFGEYRFKTKTNGKWYPWNPVVTVVLRKIEEPIPMYARHAEIIIPKINKEIGFDLIEYDWIKPYGKGRHADFVFKITRKYISHLEFDGTLTISTSNNFSGIQLIKENRRYGSMFKLPRNAPQQGYEKKVVKTITAFPGKSIKSDSMEDNNYIFRIRSEQKDGKFYRAMYGKSQGDFNFTVGEGTTARIGFKYYLNPDYTTNLEFDPKRNLFQGLSSLESIGLD